MSFLNHFTPIINPLTIRLGLVATPIFNHFQSNQVLHSVVKCLRVACFIVEVVQIMLYLHSKIGIFMIFVIFWAVSRVILDLVKYKSIHDISFLLYNHKGPTGDPNCPVCVYRAQRIWELIKGELDISD